MNDKNNNFAKTRTKIKIKTKIYKNEIIRKYK